MLFRILAEVTLLFHFLWILFIVFGFLPVLKWHRLAALHLGGLLLSLLLNTMGWYCPLTYLEHFLDSAAQQGLQPAGSFMWRVLRPLVYPAFSEATIRTVEIAFVLLNLTAYAVLFALKTAERVRGKRRRRPEIRRKTQDYPSSRR